MGWTFVTAFRPAPSPVCTLIKAEASSRSIPSQRARENFIQLLSSTRWLQIWNRGWRVAPRGRGNITPYHPITPKGLFA